MIIEKPNVPCMDTRCLCVPKSFELNHCDAQASSQLRDEIYKNILVLTNNNYETCERMWKFIYKDKVTGIRVEHTVKMDAVKYEETIHDEEELRRLHCQFDSVKQSIVDQVIAERKKRYLMEVCDMNNQQYDDNNVNNFLDFIQKNHGSVTIHADSICSTSIAEIKMPSYYLGYLRVDSPEKKSRIESLPAVDYINSACASIKRPWTKTLPAVEKVETYNDRVVKVTFVDGTFTKAVCSENDHFDLDVGITVCAMKRMLGEKGNQRYNDFIRHAHKVIVENDKKKEAEAREKAEARMKRRKAELKKAAKKLKAKEEQIDIHKQAIIRAHAEMEGLE